MNVNPTPVVIIILAGTGFYLQSQGKLLPLLSAITAKGDTSQAPSIGVLAVALAAYVGILSFMPDAEDGMLLTLLLVLGALMYNHSQSQKTGSPDLLTQLGL